MNQDKKKEKRPPKSKSEQLREYQKYSGIAVKMGLIVFVGVYSGIKIDEYFEIKKHIFTLILSLLSVSLAIYSVIKDVLK